MAAKEGDEGRTALVSSVRMPVPEMRLSVPVLASVVVLVRMPVCLRVHGPARECKVSRTYGKEWSDTGAKDLRHRC